jgi:hypothetical protein
MIELLVSMMICLIMTIPSTNKMYCKALSTVTMGKGTCNNLLGIMVSMGLYIALLVILQRYSMSRYR